MQWKVVVVAGIALISGMFAYHVADKSDNFDFMTLAGDKYQWQQFHGQWVVVNYFAEWCAPCLKEVPELNDFNAFANQDDGVSLFAVSFDQVSEEELTRLKNQYDMAFPLIRTGARHMPMERPKSLPATFLIRPDGTVARQLLGEQSAEKLQQAIELLQGS